MAHTLGEQLLALAQQAQDPHDARGGPPCPGATSCPSWERQPRRTRTWRRG